MRPVTPSWPRQYRAALPHTRPRLPAAPAAPLLTTERTFTHHGGVPSRSGQGPCDDSDTRGAEGATGGEGGGAAARGATRQASARGASRPSREGGESRLRPLCKLARRVCIKGIQRVRVRACVRACVCVNIRPLQRSF
jgi:hypothetical protein